MKKKQRQQTNILKPEKFELETLVTNLQKPGQKMHFWPQGERWGLLDYFKLVPALLISV